MREVKIYTIVVPYDFDTKPLTALLPSQAVYHEFMAVHEQLHSWSFWESFSHYLAKDLFDNPSHPYTKALMSAALPSHPDIEQEEMILTGEVPSPLNPPAGCHFHTRCPFVMDKCSIEEPLPKEVAAGHLVSCHLY